MSTFESQVRDAELRYRANTERLARNKTFLNQGTPFFADTPERVRKWFRRRGLSQDLADGAIQSGAVPLDQPIGLERVLGTADFLGVSFLERGLQVSRTVCRIAMRGATGSPTGYATGFMIAPQLMMTNNHVLRDASEAGDSVVEFDYYVRADGTPATTKVFSLRPDLFFQTDPSLDFSIVAVAQTGTNNTPLAAYGWNQLIPEEGKAIIGQWVNIIQHPNGEPKQLVLRNNEIVDTSDKFLFYVADTAPGSSGSLVCNDQWEVVALHHAGVPQRDAQGRVLNMQGQIWQTWMGEHQVKWLSNEGARISTVVAAVNALPLRAAERALFQASLQRPPMAPSMDEPQLQPQPPFMVAAFNPDPIVSDDGTATWNIPLRVSVSLGALAKPANPPIGAPTHAPAYPSEAALLEAAKNEFLQRPEVMDVHLGYRFEAGWITRDRAIVVTVDEKKSRFELQREGRSALPQSYGGYPVQLTQPNLRQILAAASVQTRESFNPLPDMLRPEEIVYLAPDVPLAAVKEKMRIKLHVSPDAGWPCLKEFLGKTKERLVIGMYDFGAKHILEAILKALPSKELVLVMQSGESLGTDPDSDPKKDQGTKKDDLQDAEVARQLSKALGKKFHFGWVKLGIKNGWVANSYHIKVAVQDSKALWLSSGNWQSSNQPLVDLAGSSDFSYLTRYNREWHAIVEHKGLAKTYEAYIRNDLKNGSRPDFTEAVANYPNIAIPAVEPASVAGTKRYFKPLVLDEEIHVIPLLSPDNYFDAAIQLIRSAQSEIILQNQTFNAPTAQNAKLKEFVGAVLDMQKKVRLRIVFRVLMASEARKNLEALVDMGFDAKAIKVQANCHTKGIIVDKKVVLLGSQNISETGISLNRDASLIFDHPKIASYFHEIFEHDWENLATQNIGKSAEPAQVGNELAATQNGWRVLTPKDYLPLL